MKMTFEIPPTQLVDCSYPAYTPGTANLGWVVNDPPTALVGFSGPPASLVGRV
jgi:hypothetical protein